MKKIHIAIICVSLAVALNLVVGCGNNFTGSKQTSESGMPSTSQSSPSGMPSTSQSSPEEVLAAAKQQVDELLAHPEKADEWRNTSFKVLEDSMNKRHAGWSPAERSTLLLAAREATNCACNLVKENGEIRNLTEIMKQAAGCMLNCGKSNNSLAKDLSEKVFTIGQSSYSWEDLYNDGIKKTSENFKYALRNDAEREVQVAYNDQFLKSSSGIGSCSPYYIYELLLEWYIRHVHNISSQNSGMKVICKEVEKIKNDTVKLDVGTKQGQEELVKNFTRISILLVEAVKAEFESLCKD